ncbi:MAG: hypothetical protein ACLTSZ_13245 [Lachnospiraceae bacterium]
MSKPAYCILRPAIAYASGEAAHLKPACEIVLANGVAQFQREQGM